MELIKLDEIFYCFEYFEFQLGKVQNEILSE